MVTHHDTGTRGEPLPLGALVGAGDTSALISRSPGQLAIAGAVGLVGITAATISAEGALVGLPGIAFLVVVGGVAWFGRCIPGVVAVIASALAIEFFTLDPNGLEGSQPSAGSLAAFVIVGVSIAAVVGWQRSIRATEVRTRRRLKLLAEITDIERARSGSTEALERLASHVVPRVADGAKFSSSRSRSSEGAEAMSNSPATE